MVRKSLLPLRRLTRIALLAALCVVLRYAFASLPNVQPITAIFLVTSVSFGLIDSWLIMAVTMLVSSFLFGFGPWVFFQILAFAVVITFWRFVCYPLSGRLPRPQVWQALTAGLMGILYGVVIDSCYAFLYSMPWWTYVMAGASFNLAHAASTLLFYPIILPIFRRFSHEKAF